MQSCAQIRRLDRRDIGDDRLKIALGHLDRDNRGRQTGAKGLGEDVLEALQYANVGQGILAGFAILFCAMILDRIVQGDRK